MDTELISRLKMFAWENPAFSQDLQLLIRQMQQANEADKALLLRVFLKTHKTLCVPLERFLSEDRSRTRFLVFDKDAEPMQTRLRQAAGNDTLKSWVAAVESVPQYTRPLPDVTKDFIAEAGRCWEESVCGNEEVFRCLLRHAVEYGKTGKTAPVLLNGPPGIGKSLISKVYAAMLQLPYAFIFGPGASVRRGLSGDPSLYTNAGPGAIVQTMITTKSGNPAVCIDEIDKAIGGHSGRARFQDELLTALDDGNIAFYDNFLEAEVDASHIPYLFTSNEKDAISVPLLDRMEILEMKAPERETILAIMQKHTLPKILDKYDAEAIRVEENTMETLVNELWRGGTRSCRPYRQALDLLVSEAYLTWLQTDQRVTITAREARNAATRFRQESFCKPIGFRTA